MSLEIIAKRRNPILLQNEPNYELNMKSYIGGKEYINSNQLIRYHRESEIAYKARLKRAIYINHIQPLVDILTGFIFKTEPTRKLNPALEAFVEQNDFENYVKNISVQSKLFPTFVLVENPKFDVNEIISEQDRIEKDIHPYLMTYKYNEIRDFSYGDDHELDWILLDNSYYSSDPFEEDKLIITYRLWTRNSYTDFLIIKKEHGKVEVKMLDEVIHGLGRVPGIFVDNSFGDNNYISSNIYENISLLSRNIFNLYSCVDESLHSSSFKVLALPYFQDKKEIDAEIKDKGLGALNVLAFNGKAGATPFLLSDDISNLQFHFDTIKNLTREIFYQVGLTHPEDTSKYQESGVAKSIEFRKTESILKTEIKRLEKFENEIFDIVNKWLGKEYEYEIIYNTKIRIDGNELEVEQLYQAFDLPINILKKKALKQLSMQFFEDFTNDELEELENEIEDYTPKVIEPINF